MQRAPVVARQRQRSASVSFASSAQDSIPSSPQPQPRRIWTSAPRSVTPLRPMDLGLSSPSPRLHRASASMTSPSSPPLQTHSPCAPSPLLWSPRRSRSYSIPESAKLASVQEPSAAGALDEGDDYDEDSSEGEDEAEAGEVYDWCALDTNASSAASASPFSSVVVLGSTSLLASNAGAGVVAPVAERLAYARPPAIRCACARLLWAVIPF